MAQDEFPAPSVHRKLIDLTLESMFQTATDGRMNKFMFGKPGARSFEKRFGTEVQYSRRGLQNAAIFVRENGPDFIKVLPIARIEDRIMHFIAENYWYLTDDAFFKRFQGSYAGSVSEGAKLALTEAIQHSDLFVAEDVLTIYPIVPLTVEADFDGGTFFLITPASLPLKVPKEFPQKWLLPEQFPPFVDHKGVKYTPNAWLGTRAKTSFAARKIRAAVLGSLALLPHKFERYLFTGRQMFGGESDLTDTYSISFGDPLTPALSENIVLTAADGHWLKILSQKLLCPDDKDRKHLKALEYFYRAWQPSEIARFPIFFMALDAMFNIRNQSSRAFIAAVGPIMGPAYDEGRLRKMLGLRGSVMHGGAPDVVESDEYHEYFVAYGENPITDLEFIAACCLRKEIFGDTMQERPHTYADLIKEKLGRTV